MARPPLTLSTGAQNILREAQDAMSLQICTQAPPTAVRAQPILAVGTRYIPRSIRTGKEQVTVVLKRSATPLRPNPRLSRGPPTLTFKDLYTGIRITSQNSGILSPAGNCTQ